MLELEQVLEQVWEQVQDTVLEQVWEQGPVLALEPALEQVQGLDVELEPG